MNNIHFMPLSRGIRLLAPGLALLTLICEHHAANVTNLQVASAPALECRGGSGGSFAPTVTADSRYVFFLSESRNLVTNDLESPFLNLYRRDLVAGKSELVSVNASGVGGANASVTRYSASSNGQIVAFATGASNLVNHPVYRYGGTYVRDLAQATTTWGIINTNGQPSLSSSGEPVISADGRLLFFIGVGFDLVSTPSSFPNRDLFSRDLVGSQNTVVSIGSEINYNCNWCGPQQYSITPDGRFVAFINEAHNLMLNVTHYGDVYVRDMQSTALTWASTNVPAYLTGNYSCVNVALSADGQCVAFWGRVYGSAAILFHHSLGTGTTTPILTNLGSYYSPVEITSDGRFVAYDDGTNVFLWDSQLQTNLLVSINREGTGPANDVSKTSVITPDGRFILFLSSATDLVSNATNGKFQVYVRDMVAGTTRLVTVNTNGTASDADLESTQPVISNDGRLVAFESTANDLVADDLNQASDVFVRDLSTATTQLVSERESTRPSSTGVGFSTKSTSSGCISSNGQWVAFASSDGNLVANDTNGISDVFVRDLITGAPQLLNLGGKTFGDAVLSGNGRYVAFTTALTNDPNIKFVGDIFRYDRQLGTSVLATVRIDGSAGGASSMPAISPDGRYVAFQSLAANLGPFTPSSVMQIYVRDMELGTNIAVTFGRFGWLSTSPSSEPQFSPDGRWLLFQSYSRELVTNYVSFGQEPVIYARDMSSGQIVLVSTLPNSVYGTVLYPSISADSRYVAFVAHDRATVWVRDLLGDYDSVLVTSAQGQGARFYYPAVSSGGRFVVYEQRVPVSAWNRQIVLTDRQTGLTNLVSINKTGTAGGNDASSNPLITPDGQFVIFASQASDLVEGDTNGVSDIFVRDRLRNITMLVSVNKHGQAGNGPSTSPVLAADGRTVLFQSFAGDLVEGDYNMKRDLFVLRPGAGDTEGDGLDDDWEMAYFSTLSRDGSADYDHDGLTDKQEFLAGTDPTDTGSILRVLALNPLGADTTTLIWPAVAGRIYRLQYKTNLTDSMWLDHPVSPNINASTASVTVTNLPDTHRFYRAALAQ